MTSAAPPLNALPPPIADTSRFTHSPDPSKQSQVSPLETRVSRCTGILAFFACLWSVFLFLSSPWRWFACCRSANDEPKTTAVAHQVLSPSAPSTKDLDASSSNRGNPVSGSSPDVSPSDDGEITIKPDPNEQLYANLAIDLKASAILRRKGQTRRAEEILRESERTAMNKFLADSTVITMPKREIRERFRNLSSHLIGYGVAALDAYAFVRLLADEIQTFTGDTNNPNRYAWTDRWGTDAWEVTGAAYEEFSLQIGIRKAMDQFLSSRPLDATNSIDQADDILDQTEDFLEQVIGDSLWHSFPASNATSLEELSEKRNACRNFFIELAKIGIRDQTGSVIACAEDYLKEIEVRRLQEEPISDASSGSGSGDESFDSDSQLVSGSDDESVASDSYRDPDSTNLGLPGNRNPSELLIS